MSAGGLTRSTLNAIRERHDVSGSVSRYSGRKIYTDWANHYLAKSGCPRLIKDLSQDVTDGVLLAQIIQIIANEKVEDINGSPRSQSQMALKE
ncbi:Neuron navigator 3 [Crenichthys baileyi]|uniref:Neuron navigator 3 n=1 Tax=Crenichthys baileyi TaxID=28760 RepID=A0AAV9RMN9_9TELE